MGWGVVVFKYLGRATTGNRTQVWGTTTPRAADYTIVAMSFSEWTRVLDASLI